MLGDPQEHLSAGNLLLVGHTIGQPQLLVILN
jgi:hypothetical protein